MASGNPVPGFINGVNVEQREYTNDSDYKDEWVLVEIMACSSIQCEAQKKFNWCWAASSRMFSKNYYPTVSITQNQAVNYVKGSEIDEGGTNTEAMEAMNYYVSNISGASLNTETTYYEIYSESTVRQFIDDGNVIYIGIGWYSDINDSSSRTGGHAVVLYGYTKIGNKYWYLIRDPWPVLFGESYFISYEKLCNGRNPQDWENYNTGVWEDAVIITTSYSNNTIPYYFD
jgi:hypothetical protein